MTSEDLKAALAESSTTSVVTESGDDTKKPAPNSLSYDDWLSCLEKTLENSFQKEQKDDKDVFVINPCPLSTITKLVADAVAVNFRSLFELDTLLSSSLVSNTLGGLIASNQMKLHAETVNIMEAYTRNAYMFGFNTLPNDDDYRMPISVWTNCAYTIQIIGNYRLILTLFEITVKRKFILKQLFKK